MSFDASGTSDPESSITDYSWDFGDGTPGQDAGAAPTVTHSFSAAGTYTVNLTRFQQGVGCMVLEGTTSLLVQRYLTGLQTTMKPVTLHQHFRTLRTFFRWSVEAGLLEETPMRGLTMKAPKTLASGP